MFEHFIDYFKSELRSKTLLYVIDKENIDKVDKQKLEQDRFSFREIRINRIELDYYNKIVDETDRTKILERLQEIKNTQVNEASHNKSAKSMLSHFE